jgi:hypothetical protein
VFCQILIGRLGFYLGLLGGFFGFGQFNSPLLDLPK